MHFTNLTSLWLREGAKYWLSAGLTTERYSWSTIKSRLDALKWLQRVLVLVQQVAFAATSCGDSLTPSSTFRSR